LRLQENRITRGAGASFTPPTFRLSQPRVPRHADGAPRQSLHRGPREEIAGAGSPRLHRSRAVEQMPAARDVVDETTIAERTAEGILLTHGDGCRALHNAFIHGVSYALAGVRVGVGDEDRCWLQVPLADGELPMGRLVVAVSKHYTAVIDGNTFDPSRDGTRWSTWEHGGSALKTCIKSAVGIALSAAP
jgi:hypothetical protein